MASILGGGMSSRLFQEARERRGLCYSTFAYVSAYADTGLMQVYAATAPDQAAEFAAVAADIAAVTGTCPSAMRNSQRARAQLKASLVMSLESPSSRADQIARQYLVLWPGAGCFRHYLASVDAVTVDDICAPGDATFHRQRRWPCRSWCNDPACQVWRTLLHNLSEYRVVLCR